MKEIFSIAPMMGYSHMHARFLWRMLSPDAFLYTEMINENAITKGRLSIDIKAHEEPIVLQVGGSDPDLLKRAAILAEKKAYHAINLNIGCPSKQVKNGKFGAYLFQKPHQVAQCVEMMTKNTKLPVSIKTRIGVDQMDGEDDLFHFISTNEQAGCQTFIIHARKAWLKGLSPQQNRTIPSINYQRVYAVKKKFPHLNIIINGEINSVSECQKHLQNVDGVMIGRAICKYPILLTKIQKHLFSQCGFELNQAIENYLIYVEKNFQKGEKLNFLLQPLQHVFYNQKGAKIWRQMLHQFFMHQKIELLFDHIKQKIIEQETCQ